VIIFPAMDLMNGHVVKLESRQHHQQEKVYGAPGLVADRWLKEGAEWLHIVDLNAALAEGHANHLALLAILPKAAKHNARIQWGGGVRDAATLRMLMEAELGDHGAIIDRVIVGTRAIKDLAWLESAAESYPDRIVVAIDAMGLDIMVAGWQEKAGVDVVSFMNQVKDMPIAAFLYTNVKVEGKGQGVDWGPVRTVIENAPKPVIFSGGVGSIDDVARFKDLKAYGIIMGSALYSGKISFTTAKAIAQS
jgi:phosphoribosylformimino-5-aminoimidazole carboxamide ribotide isomerase